MGRGRASYFQSRRQATWHPRGCAIYSPKSGTRLLRLNINSTGEWLGHQSIRLSFNRNYNDTEAGHTLRTIGDPFACVQWLRMLVGGIVCEDIQD